MGQSIATSSTDAIPTWCSLTPPSSRPHRHLPFASPGAAPPPSFLHRGNAPQRFKRIDEMKKVVVLEKKPRAADYYDPFFLPALGLLAAAVFALFGLRFTPW